VPDQKRDHVICRSPVMPWDVPRGPVTVSRTVSKRLSM
jgi:hypothetical protein